MFENLRRNHSSSNRRFPDTPPFEYPSSPRAARRNSKELTSYFRTETHARSVSPNPQQPQRKLTTILLEATPDEFKAATQHPFLKAAGEGKISKLTLSRWLSQDRLYAETYISFISSLISRVALPWAFVDDKDTSLRWRIVNLLSGGLQNIHRELQFFTETAQKYDLSLEEPWEDEADPFEPNHITEQYISLFSSFHLEPSQTLLEGLLVLWATEKCYLDAWTFASSHLKESADRDKDGGALRNEFMPNWSSPDFVKFVDDLAEILDSLASRDGALKKVEVFKALWLHVLDIEKGFWPDIADNR